MYTNDPSAMGVLTLLASGVASGACSASGFSSILAIGGGGDREGVNKKRSQYGFSGIVQASMAVFLATVRLPAISST